MSEFDVASLPTGFACPGCGRTIRYDSIPPARLQLKARLLLASIVPIIFSGVLLTIYLGPREIAGIGLVPWAVALFIAWLAMRLPKVVQVRCRLCEWKENRYRKNWAGQSLGEETISIEDGFIRLGDAPTVVDNLVATVQGLKKARDRRRAAMGVSTQEAQQSYDCSEIAEDERKSV